MFFTLNNINKHKHMKFKPFPVILTAVCTTVLTLFVAARYQDHIPFFAAKHDFNTAPVKFAAYTGAPVGAGAPVDFTHAAVTSVKAVVHINTTTERSGGSRRQSNDPYSELFGEPRSNGQQRGSGSGVVISADGYIVTNNHVIAGTDEVTVTFNDRYTTKARVVGTDAATDIAVLKVNETNVPFLEFGNSDEVLLGQWVLAVGYPLTLDATVTAGIVSAKSRSLGINRLLSSNAIESFIQTDAAVNPGNSGGALVNTSGQLVGINSAIASPTGTYAGYSYAIPANIVRKVVNDLTKYGTVQRAYLGIEYLDRKNASTEQLRELGIDRTEGVYVASVIATGGAYKAGIRKGDFIKKINGAVVRTEPQLLEQIARYQPGDNISVTYTRNNQENTVTVQLKNVDGNTSIVRTNTPSAGSTASLMGASFRPLTNEEKTKYSLKNGLVVTNVGNGILSRQTKIKPGFIVISINDEPVTTTSELQAALSSAKSIQIEGLYPGAKGMYYYNLNNGGGGNEN